MEARKLIKLQTEVKEMNCSEVYKQFKLLIYKTVDEFKNTDQTTDELISIGNMALVIAFNKYKPESGNRFSTLLVPVIRNEIKRELRLQIAQKRASNVISLNEKTFLNDEGISTKLDRVEDPINYEDTAISNIGDLKLNKLIKKLSPKKREVLELFYLKDMSQDDIGIRFNVEQASISRQLKKTIEGLRVNYGVA